MVTVNIRELTHNFSSYLKRVKAGERILVTERNIPVAEISPSQGVSTHPGWKRPVKRVQLAKGVSLSKLVIQMRKADR